MVEFIKRLQTRLKAINKGNSAEQPSSLRSEFSRPNLANSSHSTRTSVRRFITPSLLAKQLSLALILAVSLVAVYWLMKVIQIPGIPNSPPQVINKGMALFSNQDSAAAYSLFGNKPLATDNIFLRGVVITSRSPDGKIDGFAIFEIDGKQTNAISVGENLGNGLVLQSIGDESATLLYQGQKLDFKLSKPSKNKNNSPSKK